MALAGIFPGQGSQSVGMLADLSQAYSLIQHTFQEASDVLGYDLWEMAQNGPESELNKTVHTQPAMLSAGIAVWRVWKEQGGCLPVGLAGHSLGEYSALVASGSLSFGDAVSLVTNRAELMQLAVPEGTGAMAAILGLDDELVIKACADAVDSDSADVAQAVNFNSPGQVVIAGSKDAVARAMKLASDAGAKRTIALPVSVPSHCDLMRSAATQLSEKLAMVQWTSTAIPVLHNVDASTRNTEQGVQDALTHQLYKPVKWVDTINHLKHKFSAETMVEFGPGKVLFGLNRRIDRKIKTICVYDPASLDKALALCEN